MDFIINNLPWFWFALTVIFTLIEIFTVGLTTIWFAIGSLVMIFIANTKITFWSQILIFLILSLLLIIFTRPFVIKKLKIGNTKTNINSLIGSSCIVIKEITPIEKGEVKIFGNIWNAKSIDNKSIHKDKTCKVVNIEGTTLVVQEE